MAGVAGLALATGALPAGAAEASVDVGVLSKYVWRGQVLNDETVAQPSISLQAESGLYVNTWGNVDLTDQTVDADGNDASGEFTELDLTVSYIPKLEGPVAVEIGVIQYTFPFSGGATREAYAILGAGDLPLAPELAVYYDFDDIEGAYVSLGGSHSFELAEGLTLDLAGSVGYGTSDYNEGYFGLDESALNDVTLTAGLGYALTEKVSLKASVQYMVLPDDDLADAAEETFGDDSAVVAGVTASYGF
jgi:uncharacterized protein (TIGR02001 family)